jgi:hypothetical protein
MEARAFDNLFEAPRQAILVCGDALPNSAYRLHVAPDEACFYPYVYEVLAQDADRFAIFSNDWSVWVDLLGFPWRMRNYFVRFAMLWRGELYSFLPHRWEKIDFLYPPKAEVPVIAAHDVRYTPLGWQTLGMNGGRSLTIQYATRNPALPLLTARKPLGPAIYLPPYLPHNLDAPDRSLHDMMTRLHQALSYGLPVYTTWLNWYVLASDLALRAGWQVQVEDVRGELYAAPHIDYSAWRHAREQMREFIDYVVEQSSEERRFVERH